MQAHQPSSSGHNDTPRSSAASSSVGVSTAQAGPDNGGASASESREDAHAAGVSLRVSSIEGGGGGAVAGSGGLGTRELEGLSEAWAGSGGGVNA